MEFKMVTKVFVGEEQRYYILLIKQVIKTPTKSGTLKANYFNDSLTSQFGLLNA